MRTRWLGSLLFSLSGTLFSGSAGATCSPQSITVPVDYWFADRQYQLDWIYNSLDTSLTSAGKTFSPNSISIAVGKLHTTFCLPGDLTTDDLTFAFGPRQLKTERRPVVGGVMSLITLGLQPPPDWIIIRDATWKTSNGSPMLDLSVYNFGDPNNFQQGPSVHLLLSSGPAQCFGIPGTQVINVNVAMRGDALGVSSRDPSFPDEITRSAQVSTMGCNVFADVELGAIKSMKGGESLSVRFKLSGKTLPYESPGGQKYDLYSFQDVPLRVAVLHGGNAYPKCMSIASEGEPAIPLSAGHFKSCQR